MMRDSASGDVPAHSVFVAEDGTPQLVLCAVLFIDLLGVRAMNNSPDAARHLVQLEQAVRRTYRDFLSPASPWPSAFFSDTLVVASPVVSRGEESDAVSALLDQAALLQLDLMEQGFFVRGGLSLGPLHIHRGLVFGPALVEAHEIESMMAVVPRIVLSPAALRSQDPDARYRLLRDDDGSTFVDYLGPLFDQYVAPGPRFLAHRDVVTRCLDDHRADKRIWEKFRWVAEYHNHVVNQRLEIPALCVGAEDATWRFTSPD